MVERDVRYVEDTEAVKRGEPRHTVPVPEKVVMESDVLNVEETEPVKGKDPSQNVSALDSVIQREVLDLIHKAVELYERLMAGDIGIAEIYSDNLLGTATERVDIKKKELANHPTARLWLQYMDRVALLRQLTEAECTGNWELHLQVLMRSVKSSGGLTHCRGMAESQRAHWLLSMPACASISSAMQEVTSRCYASSGQYKEMTKTRQARDDEDSHTLLGYLQERNPFDCDLSMQNISTGVTADCTVNVDRAKEVGETILKFMVGNNAQGHFEEKESSGNIGAEEIN